MRMPLKFEDLSLSQFMQLHELGKEINIDYKVKKLSILSGKSIDDIEELGIDKFNELYSMSMFTEFPPKDLKVKSRVLIKGNLLVPTLSLTEMKVNQFVDFYSLLKEADGNYIKCANSLLAVMFKPFNFIGESKYSPDKHAKISKLLLSAKVGDCLGLLFFYSNFWKKCEPIMLAYLESKNKELSQLVTEMESDKEFQDFLTNGGGSIALKHVDLVQA